MQKLWLCNLNPPSALHFKFTKGLAQKYKGKYYHLNFAFYLIKLIEMTDLTFLDQFLYLIRFFWYPYCYGYDILCHTVYVIKCHIMAFYDIEWHKRYDIKCHNHSNTGIKRTVSNRGIDLGMSNQSFLLTL